MIRNFPAFQRPVPLHCSITEASMKMENGTARLRWCSFAILRFVSCDSTVRPLTYSQRIIWTNIIPHQPKNPRTAIGAILACKRLAFISSITRSVSRVIIWSLTMWKEARWSVLSGKNKYDLKFQFVWWFQNFTNTGSSYHQVLCAIDFVKAGHASLNNLYEFGQRLQLPYSCLFLFPCGSVI